jgi:cation transport ATPase
MIGVKMNHMMRHDLQPMADAHTGHDMSVMHASHDRHAGHSVAMFRDKFWLSFVLTLPVLVWSTDVQRWFGYTAPSFPGSRFIPAILATVIFFYGGLVFIRGAWGELADRKPGMMTLISLGIIVAFGTSLAGIFGLFELQTAAKRILLTDAKNSSVFSQRNVCRSLTNRLPVRLFDALC